MLESSIVATLLIHFKDLEWWFFRVKKLEFEHKKERLKTPKEV
jgi:hypothetical protein